MTGEASRLRLPHAAPTDPPSLPSPVTLLNVEAGKGQTDSAQLLRPREEWDERRRDALQKECRWRSRPPNDRKWKPNRLSMSVLSMCKQKHHHPAIRMPEPHLLLLLQQEDASVFDPVSLFFSVSCKDLHWKKLGQNFLSRFSHHHHHYHRHHHFHHHHLSLFLHLCETFPVAVWLLFSRTFMSSLSHLLSMFLGSDCSDFVFYLFCATEREKERKKNTVLF